MTEIISNKGANGSPLTDTNGNPIQGAEIIAVHQGGLSVNANEVAAVTTTDSNGEYAFTDGDLPATYMSGNTAQTEYVDLYARIGDPASNPRQATPIRPHQGYQLEANVITSFEAGDLSNFPNGNTGKFAVNQNAPVYEGSYSLKADGNSFPVIWSYEGEGLNYYPQRGDKWAIDFSIRDAQGRFIFAYGIASGNDPRDDGYMVQVRFDKGDITLEKRSGGSINTIASTGINWESVGTKYRLEINWKAAGVEPNHIATVIDPSDGSTLDEISGRDDEYTARGVGFQVGNSGASPEVVIDNARLIT